MFAGAGAGGLEGEAHNTFDGVAGEDGHFGGGFPGLAAVGTTALTGVFAFAVFSNDDPV